jgi:hypothetical protein
VNITGNSYEKTIDMSGLSRGVYILNLNIDGEKTYKKIIKN